jgi:hypothetical protein
LSDTGSCYKCGAVQAVTNMKCSACGTIAPVKTQKAPEKTPWGCMALIVGSLALGVILLFRLLSADPSEPKIVVPPLEAGAERIPVRGDPARATYYLLRMEKMRNGHYEVLTRRDGSSGTSYARREIDCIGDWTFRYLGEGNTREDAEMDSPNPSAMTELVPGSISSEVTSHVCLSIPRQ